MFYLTLPCHALLLLLVKNEASFICTFLKPNMVFYNNLHKRFYPFWCVIAIISATINNYKNGQQKVQDNFGTVYICQYVLGQKERFKGLIQTTDYINSWQAEVVTHGGVADRSSVTVASTNPPAHRTTCSTNGDPCQWWPLATEIGNLLSSHSSTPLSSGIQYFTQELLRFTWSQQHFLFNLLLKLNS